MILSRKKLLLALLITLPFLPVFSKLDYAVMDYKNGARAAVCITFDWEDDYPHSIYAADRIADLKGDLPEKTERVLKILDGHGVKATFFAVGIMAVEFEESFEILKESGNEIASHGNYHKGYMQLNVEDPQKLQNFGELELYEQMGMIENTEVLMDVRTKGFRAPGLNFNDDTLLALETLGYVYDSSFQTNGRVWPFHPEVNGKRLELLEIPVSGEDATSWDLYGRKYDSPDPNGQWKMDFLDIYSREGVYVPLLHVAFIGKDSGLLSTLEELLLYMKGYDVWMTTLGEMADWHISREKLDAKVMNPKGLVSLLEIDNSGSEMDGLTVKVDGKVRVLGNGAVTSYENGSTKITFSGMKIGKKRLVLIRF